MQQIGRRKVADPTTGSTFTVLTVDDGRAPDFHAILRAIKNTRAQVFDTIALPPEMLRLEDPRLPTADRILADMRGAERTLFGMGVVFNKWLSDMPVRVHRKRRWMTEAYHRRIQKKWNKRFGVGPAAILMNTREVFRSPSTTTNAK